MGFLQRSANLVTYEWKRALAKKKLLVLVILVLMLQVGLFVLLYYFFTNPPPDFVGPSLDEVKDVMWLVGVLGPQSLFIPLIAIVIAGGSMSEEYEHGTADILLSKPITKIEYMTGKFLGGLSLLAFVIALTTILGATLAYGIFGPQESIQFAPVIYLTLLYSNMLFFSMTFMFSEVFRRTTLSMMAVIGILVASVFIGGILSTMNIITGEQLYLEISKWLPNWSVSNLPSFVASELITATENPFLIVSGGRDIQLAAAIIAIYTIPSILIATLRLIRSDVTKRAD